MTNEITASSIELALNPLDDIEPSPQPASDTNNKNIWSKLPQLLRWIGGISLLGSAITFLLGGWMDAEPLIRYYSFFALTSALSIAGVFCGLRLKEDKGARTFLSLGTAFIPVLFCQLGALVYAQTVGYTSQFSEYLEIFQFSPIGIPLLAGTIAIALVLLTFYAFAGFSAMARPAAKRLTAVYLAANSILLLPFRGDSIVAGLGFALLVGLVYMDRKYFSKITSLRTWDGRAMRALLYTPFGLLLLRSALLYSVSGVILSLLFAAIAALFFFGLPAAAKKISHKRFYQHISIAPLFLAWIYVAEPLINLVGNTGINNFATLIVLPFAGIVALLSRHTSDSGRSFRLLAGGTAVVAVILQMALGGGLVPAMIALGVSILLIILSYNIREKGLLFIGIAGTAISLIYHFRYAVEFYQSNLWLSLAGTGVAVILTASYIERNWQKLLGQGKDLRTQLSDWN